ncbi:MAG: ArsR family transcriptional regulator [Bacteroidetes bacterium]|nr:MAG: ArsR family transcriptional regulator [Bacteroidota bacterium]
MFKPLDPLLHSRLRLAIMSLLVSEGKADFNRIKEVTEATSGNISVQIQKLEKAKYLTVKKSFKNNYPHTEVALTPIGLEAFDLYVEAIKDYLPKS